MEGLPTGEPAAVAEEARGRPIPPIRMKGSAGEEIRIQGLTGGGGWLTLEILAARRRRSKSTGRPVYCCVLPRPERGRAEEGPQRRAGGRQW